MSAIQWHRLDPATIERAIKTLLVDLYPGARPIDGSGGDGGRDVRWDCPAGLVIFEIKSFAETRLTQCQRRQIKQSLAQAATHRPARWVLVMPTDHSPAEETWFDDLNASHPNIDLEWLGVTWLDLQFGKREYLRRLVEGEAYEVLALAREFQQEQAVITSLGDVVERAGRLGDRAQAVAAHWRTDFFTAPEGVGWVLTERVPGAAPVDAGVAAESLFAFPTDDPAAAATHEQLTDVLDYGGEIRVEARYLAGVEPADPALRELFQLAGPTDEVWIGSVATNPDGLPSPNVQLVIVTATGAVRRRLTLHAEPITGGRRGTRVTARDASGMLTVVIRADREEHGATMHTRLSGTGIAGHYPYAVRAAFDLFLAAEPTDRLEIRINNRPLGNPVDGDNTRLAQLLADARETAATIAALERLQDHTGQLFPIPDHVGRAEGADLRAAARLLDGETLRTSLTGLGMPLRTDRLEEFIETFIDAAEPPTGGGLLIEAAGYSVTCGQHTIELRPVTIHAPHVALTNAAEIRAAVGTGTEPVARFDCAHGEGVYVRFAQPV